MENKPKYVIITGGVLSGLGKGVVVEYWFNFYNDGIKGKYKEIGSVSERRILEH